MLAGDAANWGALVVKTCLECPNPVRKILGTDLDSEHCSDACAVATWNREQAQGRIVCVGSLTTASIDHQLSTTGWTIPEGGDA